MLKLKLIDIFWITAFSAALLSGNSDIHFPAIALSVLLIATAAYGDLAHETKREVSDYLPLAIGPLMGPIIAKADLVEPFIFIGMGCLLVGTIYSVSSYKSKPTNGLLATYLVAWATLLLDATPSIYTTNDVIVHTVVGTIGLLSSTALLRLNHKNPGICLAIFWTIHLSLVWFNATSLHYGIGWVQRWIS